jgi:hypothetical protein
MDYLAEDIRWIVPFMPEILVRALTPQQISGALYLQILETAQRALMFRWAHEAHKVDGGCFQVERVASPG